MLEASEVQDNFTEPTAVCTCIFPCGEYCQYTIYDKTPTLRKQISNQVRREYFSSEISAVKSVLRFGLETFAHYCLSAKWRDFSARRDRSEHNNRAWTVRLDANRQ